MRNRLGPVDQHPGVVALGHLRHLGHGQDRAQRVGGLRQGNQARAGAQQRLILFEHDLAAVGDGNDPQDGPFLLGDHLPGHDVGVMFQRGEDDLVARLQELPPVGLRNEIDAFRRAAHEDDFFGRRCAEKRLYLLPRLLVGVGRTGRQRVGAAMDVRVVAGVKVRNGVDHALRLLRRRGVVEPDQRPAVDLLIEHGKIAANRGNVERPRPQAADRGRLAGRDRILAERALQGRDARIAAQRPAVVAPLRGTDLLHERPDRIIGRGGRRRWQRRCGCGRQCRRGRGCRGRRRFISRQLEGHVQ